MHTPRQHPEHHAQHHAGFLPDFTAGFGRAFGESRRRHGPPGGAVPDFGPDDHHHGGFGPPGRRHRGGVAPDAGPHGGRGERHHHGGFGPDDAGTGGREERRHRHGGFGPGEGGPDGGRGERRQRRGGRGFGPPPVPPLPPFPPGFGPGPMGPGGPMGGGRGRHRGTRRGDVRVAVLALLGERPMHGYEIIQTIEERSGGVWRPSPGSIYPTLQLLADEGLVTADETGGRRLFTLTDAGREQAGRHGDRSPFTQERDETFEVAHRFRDEVAQLGLAVWQVAQVGTEAQQTEILGVLADARRRAYQLLADGPTPDPATGPTATGPADGPTPPADGAGAAAGRTAE